MDDAAGPRKGQTVMELMSARNSEALPKMAASG
jgi:hypothetical protein